MRRVFKGRRGKKIRQFEFNDRIRFTDPINLFHHRYRVGDMFYEVAPPYCDHRIIAQRDSLLQIAHNIDPRERQYVHIEVPYNPIRSAAEIELDVVETLGVHDDEQYTSRLRATLDIYTKCRILQKLSALEAWHMELKDTLVQIKNSFSWFLLTVRVFRNWPEIYRHRFFKRSVPLLLELRSGPIFCVSHKDSMLPVITEIWDRKVYGSLPELSGLDKPAIIDIGGHIGAFALFALSKSPGADIYVYEPSQVNLDCLRATVKLNHAERQVHAFGTAVCATAGKRDLYMSTNSATNSLFNAEAGTRSSAQVDCVTLEDILRSNNMASCDLLKLDCEGAEYEILMNTPSELFSKIHNIILEWHDVRGRHVRDLESFLQKCGYIVELNPKPAMPVEGFLRARRSA